ncbi:FAD-dependent oxidoreductase [Aquitalea sp. USM4]|uniref:FAD-dependent oxidoreductase n=1 Tax=Aquitalea sp. USM4 TaxID=1590041 RepID=UPI00103B887F|nr:FAD-dependent oxidoreductase [Aquitalea sp. USM4]QBJ79446.1 spermidine dehydrogenase [Aquitalea sp. USM4]
MPEISRRDFLNGMAVLGLSGLMRPADALAAASSPYPPRLTGLRGNHPGSFEVAHGLAWGGGGDFGKVEAGVENYDLIIIGGGISGLSAAYFYRKHVKSNARILVLDNHDDFGGHAKRNEFLIGGREYISYGGAQSLDNPSAYGKTTLRMLSELGVDLSALARSYDKDFFKKYQMTSGVFFDEADFGKSMLLKSGMPAAGSVDGEISQWLPGLLAPPAFQDVIQRAPLTDAQKKMLRTVLAGSSRGVDYFKGALGEKRFYEGNYIDYLSAVYQIKDKGLLKLLSMTLAEEAALGGRGVSMPLAQESGLLGIPDGRSLARVLGDASLIPDAEGGDEYTYHFPDGNATLARLLVAKLIPGVANFKTVDESLLSRFDYQKLDNPDNPVRIRLSSTVVKADNKDNGTFVQYVRNGKLYEARSACCVMAAWHMMAAHIIPSLPASQKAAMKANVKMPLIYAQVALRNWKAIQKSGVAASYCPGSYYQFVQMDFPVRFSSYAPDRSPDKPTVLFMSRMPCPAFAEGSVPDLLRQGRAEVLSTDFATYEKNIRQQLAAMYGPAGLDVNKDIAAITVNRWSHGYTFEDAMYNKRPAYLTSSMRHGRIAMANADATGRAYVDGAIDAAWKAVRELKRYAV